MAGINTKSSKWDFYRHFIVSMVRGVDVVRRMCDIPDEIKSEIENLGKYQSAEASTRKLLEFFEKRKKPGDWNMFIHSLQQADYPYVCKVLKSGMPVEKNDYQRHRETIKIFRTDLLDVDPKHVIDLCYEKAIVTKDDKDEIENESKYRGSESGMTVFLDRIPRRDQNWFYKFLEVLFRNKYDFIVKKIDIDIYKELKCGVSGDEFVKKCKDIDKRRYSGMETDAEDDVCQKVCSRKRRRALESENQNGSLIENRRKKFKLQATKKANKYHRNKKSNVMSENNHYGRFNLGGECYIYAEPFKGMMLVHIRQYIKGCRTYTGIALKPEKWKKLEMYKNDIDISINYFKMGKTVDRKIHLGSYNYVIVESPKAKVDIGKWYVPRGTTELKRRKGINLKFYQWEMLKSYFTKVNDILRS